MAVKPINVERTVVALLLGGGLALLPFLFYTFPALQPSPPLDAVLQQAFGFLSLPGLIVGIIFAGGYVHEVSFSIVSAANVVVYSLIAYGLLRWRHNRHERLNAA